MDPASTATHTRYRCDRVHKDDQGGAAASLDDIYRGTGHAIPLAALLASETLLSSRRVSKSKLAWQADSTFHGSVPARFIATINLYPNPLSLQPQSANLTKAALRPALTSPIEAPSRRWLALNAVP